MTPRVPFLSRNWRLKLFSLLLSCVLFLVVSGQSSARIEVEYSIQYEIADDIMLVSDAIGKVAPRKLVATLKGPWATFRNYGDVEAITIDLTGSEPGTVLHRIDPADIDAGAGMSIVTISPSQVEITLDRRVEKLVPVEIDPLGRPAFGFEIAEMRADPPRVKVEGPMAKMRILDFVYTRPVNLRDREDDISEQVELRPPTPPLRLVDRTSVTVFVDISEEMLQRTFEMSVRIDNAPKGTRIAPETVVVTLKGPRRFVDRLAKDSLTAVIDANPEAQVGGSFEKVFTIEPALPERTQITGTVPKIAVWVPRRRRN